MSLSIRRGSLPIVRSIGASPLEAGNGSGHLLCHLLAKNAENELDDSGQAELECLLARVDQLTIVKTRARYTLRQQAQATGA